MKVLLGGGSPHKKGCTDAALDVVAGALEAAGISTDRFWIGNQPLSGCIGCGYCAKHGKCQYNDSVNAFLALAGDFDGFVFGAPVHFASVAASMMGFMNRVFYTDHNAKLDLFTLKPGAVIVSARRAGTTAALDELTRFLTYAQMPVVSSRYWNMVHGKTPDEVAQDSEGVQIMRVLGRNMAWLLESIKAGKEKGVALPEAEPRISTNFIR